MWLKSYGCPGDGTDFFLFHVAYELCFCKSDGRLLNVVETGPNSQQLGTETRETNELTEAGTCTQSSSPFLRETGEALGSCSAEDHTKLESLGMTLDLTTCSTGCCDSKHIPKRDGFSPTK